MACNPLIIPPDSGLDFAWRATVDVFPPITPASVPRTGIPVLNIPRGRGYLELLSPDCFVEWQAITWHDRVQELETPCTGPASRNGIWIQDGVVTLTATVWGAPRFHVDAQNGIGSNPATVINPQLTVIWHPGATPSDIEDSWRFRAMVASDIGFPLRLLAPTRAVDLYCVGHARHWGFQSVDPIDLIVGTVSGSPLANQPYRSVIPATIATGCASPWSAATLTNNGNTAATYNFTWDRYPLNVT